MEFFFSLLTTFTLKVHTTLEIKSKLNPVTFSLFKFTFVLPVYILCKPITNKYKVQLKSVRFIFVVEDKSFQFHGSRSIISFWCTQPSMSQSPCVKLLKAGLPTPNNKNWMHHNIQSWLSFEFSNLQDINKRAGPLTSENLKRIWLVISFPQHPNPRISISSNQITYTLCICCEE